MGFADLKNAFVFRRIVATHPDILRLAADAGEAMGEDAAAQVLGELALDVARQAAAVSIT